MKTFSLIASWTHIPQLHLFFFSFAVNFYLPLWLFYPEQIFLDNFLEWVYTHVRVSSLSHHTHLLTYFSPYSLTVLTTPILRSRVIQRPTVTAFLGGLSKKQCKNSWFVAWRHFVFFRAPHIQDHCLTALCVTRRVSRDFCHLF